MRPLSALSAFFALAGIAGAAESPPAPDMSGRPAEPPAAPKPGPAVADILEKLPGTWSGLQQMRSPRGQIMTMEVSETYAFGTLKDGTRALIGEQTYTLGSGGAAKTFKGVSRTWVDKDGVGHAEVEQSGKTTRFDAVMSGGSLVFLPEGQRKDAKSATGITIERDGDTPFLHVRGFQTGPDGAYLIDGKLLKMK